MSIAIELKKKAFEKWKINSTIPFSVLHQLLKLDWKKGKKKFAQMPSIYLFDNNKTAGEAHTHKEYGYIIP